MSENVPLITQELIEDIDFNSLPSEWIGTDLPSFSKHITLFDYQQEALKNAIELLYYYFESLQRFNHDENEKQNIERKKIYYNEMRQIAKDLIDSLGITNKKNKILFNRLKQFYQMSEETNIEKIHFLNFVNRMSFWMATGSGKTIVLVKLIEILDRLMQSKIIPENDILILTHREDLIKQIKEHINEYNELSNKKIMLWDLKKHDDVKNGSILAFKDNINIFIYRSDLISDETKEKLLNFEDIENDGKWYLLLDEAHKGDKEDSKRQIYYSILTRNGFLFNFSATFTDAWDILSTVYNFNLDTFIRRGYGKNVYLSQQELNAFQDKKDFFSEDKQKIVLKSLILLALTKIAKNEIDKKLENSNHYHNPLLVSLVNSVNTEDSDLEMFFRQMERIAHGDINDEVFSRAKDDLIQEFSEHPRYVFGRESLIIKKEAIDKIKIKDILKYVFNSSTFGNIEVIKIPQNKKELIFKLKTSDTPFALIKIGDISKWLKAKLENYEINESHDNTSYFQRISKDNSFINILMGSRAFYEGWDSNRPNVMIFINIGKGDAKKYVTQSIGRGIRIQPIKGKRKRLLSLKHENNLLAKNMYSKLNDEDLSLIETLFILGTNKNNVLKILESIKYERKISGEIIELDICEEGLKRTLLIPIYKERKTLVPVDELPKFEGNKELITNFIDWLSDERILYAIFSNNDHLDPMTIKKIKEFIKSGKFIESKEYDVFLQTSKLISHVNILLQELNKFKKLEDEIIHFKRIKIALEPKEANKLKQLINGVKSYKDPKKAEGKLKEQLEKREINIDEYTFKIKELNKTSNEAEFRDLRIKNIVNHYYTPLILSNKEKIDYINHIINVESERKFVENIEKYIQEENNFFKRFDWWMFSKLDEHTDDVYIPYYNKSNNKIAKFKPDFIFWLKKDSKYYIIFTDPKGISHTDYEHKVDGYRQIFENGQNKKTFDKDNLNIEVHLFLYTGDKNKLSEGYKNYWFDSFNEIANNISIC